MSDPFTAEGEEITAFVAQMPSAKLEAPEAYPRGTTLTLNVQVRVKNAFTDEDRKGNLFVRHNLVIEDVAITDVLTPAQRKAVLDAAETQLAGQQPTLDEALITEVDDKPTVESVSGPETVQEPAPVDTDSGDHFDAYDDADSDVAPAGNVVALADTNGRSYGFLAADQNKGLDDDDPEHAWMDEDTPEGLNVDLRAVVGF